MRGSHQRERKAHCAIAIFVQLISVARRVCGEQYRVAAHASVIGSFLGAPLCAFSAPLPLHNLIHAENCRQNSNAPILGGEEFPFNQSFDEVLRRAGELYTSPKRMPQRAFFDENSRRVLLPLSATWAPRPTIEVSPLFIESVRRHIERALELRYVDAITMSDMGHAHFFIPKEAWQELTSGGESNLAEFRFEKISADPRVKILYHTAEQIKVHDDNDRLLEDRHLQWRFFTRNLVGDNRGQGQLDLVHEETHSHNTARDYQDDYRYWGAGFYLSAHEKGCFKYQHKGEERAFDINLNGYWN